MKTANKYYVVDISTAHVTEKTWNYLTDVAEGRIDAPLMVYMKDTNEGPLGAFIYFLESGYEDGKLLPEDLEMIRDYARIEDAGLVCLDSGADEVADLPTYVW